MPRYEVKSVETLRQVFSCAAVDRKVPITFLHRSNFKHYFYEVVSCTADRSCYVHATLYKNEKVTQRVSGIAERLARQNSLRAAARGAEGRDSATLLGSSEVAGHPGQSGQSGRSGSPEALDRFGGGGAFGSGIDASRGGAMDGAVRSAPGEPFGGPSGVSAQSQAGFPARQSQQSQAALQSQPHSRGSSTSRPAKVVKHYHSIFSPLGHNVDPFDCAELSFDSAQGIQVMASFLGLYEAMASISIIPPAVSVGFPLASDLIRTCELILSCQTLKLNAKASNSRQAAAAADLADPWQDESLAAITSQPHGGEVAGVWDESAGGGAEFATEMLGKGKAHFRLPLIQGERDITTSKSVLLVFNRFGEEKLNLSVIPAYVLGLLDNVLSATAKYDSVLVEFVSAMITRHKASVPASAVGPSSATQGQQEEPQYSRRMGLSFVDKSSGLQYTASTPSSLVEQGGTPWAAFERNCLWNDVAFEMSVPQVTLLHRILRTATQGFPANMPISLILSDSDDLLIRTPLRDRDDIVGVFTYVFPVRGVRMG